MTPTTPATAPTLDFIGLDIVSSNRGSKQCVVARPSGDIVLNELGGMTTATLVSFKDKERLLGEAAVLASSTNPKNTVDYLNLLLGKTLDQVVAQLSAFPCQRSNFTVNAAGLPVASVDYNGATTEFSPVQLMAMLLAKIGRNVTADVATLKLGVAIPPRWTDAEKSALLQAIKIAGFGAATLAMFQPLRCSSSSQVCYHAALHDHPLPAINLQILTRHHRQPPAAGEQILATAYDPALGSSNYDRHLYAHFAAKLKASHGLQLEPDTRQSRRLLHACEQLKKLLSTIPEAIVTVENLVPDADIALSISKSEFEHLGRAETAGLRTLLEGLFADVAASPSDISMVEVVGGGTRMPVVQDAISAAIGTHVTLGRMLDSATAVAIGAAFSIDSNGNMLQEVTVDAAAIAAELAMQAQDDTMALLADKRNEIETFVYEIRAKQSQKHGHLIESAVVGPFLDAAEDWFYSDQALTATLDQATATVHALKSDIVQACQAYFAAVAKDDEELERQLELESEKAALEHKDDDDHDFRKALTHATKFFDLRPDEAADVNAVKLSLYLNVAQCYLKMESWHKAVVQCKDALDIDPTNTKALYRRALGYERLKDYARAFDDSQKAFALAPDDKAVVALNERLKAHMKKQQDKEKKMWTKAFA
ncbi:hypothetical protein DYB37_007353 [Aphanomyces astaci]|uniref:Uncharacterized protein n=3 Tax=Aphanomyces astaci TaxID=112090 RepID=A0A3R6XAF2_APHAT|nr:hypothetical protein DYB35_007467 [Aphanomyces astaci]RHZ21095.1 hypothetical protein DYB37_007353 [Aphanomyces astaci]